MRKKAVSQISEQKSRAEKIFLRIGSLCGVIISIFTIYDRVTKPSDPNLIVTFFESASDTLTLFPSINTAIDETEDIPLQLRIENKGGKIAKNTKLYISHFLGVALTTLYKKEEKRTWNSPNEAMKQLYLALEDINPGESFLVPISVRLPFPKEFQRIIRGPATEVSDKELLTPRLYPLYCDLSSDTSRNQRSVLQIVVGNLDVLKEQTKDIFWLGHGSDGVTVLKMKEDYPSN